MPDLRPLNSISELSPGDTIIGVDGGNRYMVVQVEGERATVVRTAAVFNPSEWLHLPAGPSPAQEEPRPDGEECFICRGPATSTAEDDEPICGHCAGPAPAPEAPPEGTTERPEGEETEGQRFDSLIVYHQEQCSRYTFGQCSLTRCLIRGGHKYGQPADYAIATCEAHETAEALERLRALNRKEGEHPEPVAWRWGTTLTGWQGATLNADHAQQYENFEEFIVQPLYPPPAPRQEASGGGGDGELREAVRPFAVAIAEFDQHRSKAPDNDRVADWRNADDFTRELTLGHWRRLRATLDAAPPVAAPPGEGVGEDTGRWQVRRASPPGPPWEVYLPERDGVAAGMIAGCWWEGAARKVARALNAEGGRREVVQPESGGFESSAPPEEANAPGKAEPFYRTATPAEISRALRQHTGPQPRRAIAAYHALVTGQPVPPPHSNDPAWLDNRVSDLVDEVAAAEGGEVRDAD